MWCISTLVTVLSVMASSAKGMAGHCGDTGSERDDSAEGFSTLS